MSVIYQKSKIILMPGLNGTDGLFVDFAKRCPEHIEVIPLAYPFDEMLSYQQLTSWIYEKLQSVSGDLILLGESFSGPLALFVANALPDKVKAVILVASFIYPPRLPLLKLLPWQLGFILTKLLYFLRSKLTKNGCYNSIVNNISVELQKVKPAVLAHRVRETLSVNAANALINCHCPILYLQAEHDLIVPKSALTKILQVNKSVQAISLPTQHFILQSMPSESWQAITKFLR